MIEWIILGIIVLIVVLILMIPVGADIRYEDEVIRISAKAAGIRFQILPRKKRSEKPAAEKEKKPEEKKEEKKPESGQKEKKKLSIPFNTEEIFELIKALLRCFGRFNRKFRVERFVLHWIAPSWNDPYLSARIFSVVNAAMSQLSPICTERFRCRDSSVWTDIDFTREYMFLEFGLTFTIRIGKIIGTGIEMAFAVLKIYLRSKRRVKREAKEEQQALEQWYREHPEDRPAAEERSAAENEPAVEESAGDLAS